MDSSRWQKIQEVFDVVVDLPRHEQVPQLKAVCDGDDELYQEVMDLLQADTSVDDMLPAQFELEDSDSTLILPQMRPGSDIGPYKIIRKIGEGGMGWVYKAEDTRLERFVALKCLAPSVATDDKVRQRLLLEAKAISRLDHPNICVIHDMGSMADGGLYIAMQYYTGETLESCLERGSLDIGSVLKIAKQIAYGLSAAHQQDIIHRDIKPANILLSEDGIVKILDFGIAKLAGTDITLAGARMGTLTYMSPEQLQGDDIGPHTDVWAMATILYEMLTATPAFSGEKSAEVLHTILHDEPNYSLTIFKRHPNLLRLMQAMLQKDPAQRISSMHKVMQWLSSISPWVASDTMSESPEPAALIHKPKKEATFSDAYLFKLAAVLTAYVGPAAPSLIQRYSGTAKTSESLIRALVSHLAPELQKTVLNQLNSVPLD